MSGYQDLRRHYHTELLRGMEFSLAAFDENRFRDDHAHCVACGRKIAEQDWPDVEHEAYVTRVSLGSEDYLSWICKSCFQDLQEALRWTVTQNDTIGASSVAYPTTPPRDAGPGNFSARFPFAKVGWSPSEVVAIAQSMGNEITISEAERLLVDNERFIKGVMTTAGLALIRNLIAPSRSETEDNPGQ